MTKVIYIQNGNEIFSLKDTVSRPTLDTLYDLLRGTLNFGEFLGKYALYVKGGKGLENIVVDTGFSLDDEYVLIYDTGKPHRPYIAVPLEKAVKCEEILEQRHEDAVVTIAKIAVKDYASLVVALTPRVTLKKSLQDVFVVPLQRRVIKGERNAKVPYDAIVEAFCEVSKEDRGYLWHVIKATSIFSKHYYHSKLFTFLNNLAILLYDVAELEEYDIKGYEDKLHALEELVEKYDELVE